MESQRQDKDGAQIGDKVRIRSGIHAKVRGVVQAKVGESLEIQLDEGPLIHARPEEITNYSLAARRAWQVMPKQAGRHQLAVPRKRMASLRLDINVLDDLDKATELGLIPNKEQAVNTWLRQQLDLLFGEEPRSGETQE
jgi:preprotein translocase subunit YajC